MRCPSLAELPPPPEGRTGWPWTVETPQLPPTRADGSPWPRISIVTPSYNQGQFIEETIRSILLQGYPDLDYIIMDGGSTDDSVAIIRKYEPWLSHWVSEKDRGQAHAINKGLARVTGTTFNWINSDDLLFPSALRFVGELYRQGHVVGGTVMDFDTRRRWRVPNRGLSSIALVAGKRYSFRQPGLWLEPASIATIGGIDEDFHYVFDWDLVIRYLERFPGIVYTPKPLAFFRFHGNSKTVGFPGRFFEERLLVRRRLLQTMKNPAHRSACRDGIHRDNWERHLTDWRTDPKRARRRVALRMVVLALRRPRQRMSRFWFGALRRALLQ